MAFQSTGKVTLRTNLADYPVTKALKEGAIQSELVAFDFAGPKVANNGFKPMVREGAFVAGELAIATYLQAKAFGKKLVALPAPIVSRFQHHTIAFDSRYGEIGPKDLNGTTFGIRAYSVTTVMWVRGILQHEYGVNLSTIRWMTIEDPHVAEFVDPLSCTRVQPGETLDRLLVEGKVAAAILGDKLPDVPTIKHLIPNPHAAAQAWSERTGVRPINHLFCVHEDLPKERPDVVREIYRMLIESNAAAPESSRQIMAPFGVEANRAGLQMAIDFSMEQGLLPRALSVEDLFDDLTRSLGA